MRIDTFIHKYYWLIAIFLLIAFSGQVLYAIFTQSSNTDERVHVNGGYKYLKTGEFDLAVSPEHPPLLALNAIPFLQYNFSLARGLSDNSYGERYEHLINQARMVTLLYGILLGVFVFIWTKELFGIPAGLLALFLFSFEPNIIVNSSLVTTDMSATCFMFIATYFFWKFIQHNTIKTALVSGTFLGIALLAKFTSILLVPVFLILAALNFRNKGARFGYLLFVLFVVSLFVVNAAYLFKGSFKEFASYDFKSHLLGTMAKIAKHVPVPLPSAYLLGFDYARAHMARHIWGEVYLLGHYEGNGIGWWYYFIVAFFIKTQIPLLIMLLFSSLMLSRHPKPGVLFLIAPALLLFIIASFFNRLNIGLRHVLPMYPFLIVIASASILFIKSTKTKLLLFSLMAWCVISAVLIAPYYLSYFNEFIGGSKNGYKYLADSNIDWGINSKAIDTYVKKSPVPIIIQPGCEYTPGRILITVNHLVDLNTDHRCHEWLRDLNLTPVNNGGSFLVFDVPLKK